MLRTILAILGILVAGALLFLFFQHRKAPVENHATPLNIDLQEIKPTAWAPVEEDGLIKISVDRDKDIEWLFLYRDTGGTNQIGGVIYDAQNQPKGVSGMNTSQQAPAYLIPYRLMPDYTASKSHGYLGDQKVDYLAVSVKTDKKEEHPDDSDAIVGNRLQVSGQYHGVPNRFSVFWWMDSKLGYGGALAYTPGWFSLSAENPNDWPEWAGGEHDTKDAIDTIFAWEPQIDRSNICRRVEWRLQGDQDQNTLQFESDYENGDLVFCQGSEPAEPAFPEAQVLAYLLDKNKERWQDEKPLVSFNHVSVRDIIAPEITVSTTTVGVLVDFLADGALQRMVWQVKMEPPTALKSSVHWRIVDVYNR
jgi:hypothetical protein